MSTLGIMKERIASELRRDDLSSATEFRVLAQVSDIHDAIHTAISEYQHEQFYFNQSRGAVVFNTVAAQDIYTSADDADIARIIKIEYGFITISGMAFRLRPIQAADIEAANLGAAALSAQPAFYSWYAESIRLEPIPNDVWSVRFGCMLKTTAPASDAEASNRWMTDAETLIRCRAKAEIYAHVIKEQPKAQIYYELAQNALKNLREKTESIIQPESALVEPWDPYS